MGKTRIIVQYGGNEPVFLRGEGIPNLSWEKGIPLKNMKADEWTWETDLPFLEGQFKVLIKDAIFELGENHPLYPGVSVRINPKFPKG